MARNNFNNNSPYLETIPSQPFDFGKTRPATPTPTPSYPSPYGGGGATEPDERHKAAPTTTPMSEKKDDENVTVVEGLDVNGHLRAATVGWLVGIKGACRGMDFRLHSGVNSVGRNGGGMTYQVNLEGDTKIPRSNPVVEVIYDSKHRAFVIVRGNSTELAYVNGTGLYMPTPLNAYDRIEICDSELLFVPLCGSHFDWEEPKDAQK